MFGPESIRPLPGVAVQRSLFPEGVEAGPDTPPDPGPEVAEPAPSGPPPDTRAWRKSWRKRWRRGSSYRDLTLLQRELLRYIEDNAGDDGSILATRDQLSEALSSPREIVSRDAVRCATAALSHKGLILTTQQTTQNSTRTITRYVRVNFREYQEQAGLTTQVTTQQTTHSSRGKQRKQKEDPQLAALVAALGQKYRDRTGEPLDIPPKQMGDLQAIRNATGDDPEVLRRWDLFLGDKYYPTKSINRFRAAQSKYTTRKKRKPPQDISSLPESSRQLLAQMESYSGKRNE